VLDIIGRIKNVGTDGGALCRSEDVGEAEAVLVAVPRPYGWHGEVAVAGAFEEPDDE
jgi:hypothetical protein